MKINSLNLKNRMINLIKIQKRKIYTTKMEINVKFIKESGMKIFKKK